jgi:hypothetical protein
MVDRGADVDWAQSSLNRQGVGLCPAVPTKNPPRIAYDSPRWNALRISIAHSFDADDTFLSSGLARGASKKGPRVVRPDDNEGFGSPSFSSSGAAADGPPTARLCAPAPRALCLDALRQADPGTRLLGLPRRFIEVNGAFVGLAGPKGRHSLEVRCLAQGAPQLSDLRTRPLDRPPGPWCGARRHQKGWPCPLRDRSLGGLLCVVRAGPRLPHRVADPDGQSLSRAPRTAAGSLGSASIGHESGWGPSRPPETGRTPRDSCWSGPRESVGARFTAPKEGGRST